MEVKDPHKFEQRYTKWRSRTKKIKGISEIHSKAILQFLDDLEEGRNVAKGTKRGKRSYSRIYSYLIKLKFIFGLLKKRKIDDLNIDEDKIHKLFLDMREGRIKKQDGKPFKSTGDYAKAFVSFWHWYMRVNRKQGKMILDITGDLDTSKGSENTFVYFTKEQMETVMSEFTKEEALMILFLFDAIVRFPKEFQNIRKQDITEQDGYVWLNVREESAKTYGRRFKLMLCGDQLKKHIKNFEAEDYLFDFSAPLFNKKLKKAFLKFFGDSMTIGGKKFSEVSGYDLRHSGACYWRKGAYHQKIDALMYRGGWTDLRMLNYYTKKLGMKDNIEEDDLMTLENKTKLEKEVEKLKKNRLRQDKEFEKLKDHHYSLLNVVKRLSQSMEDTGDHYKIKKKEFLTLPDAT